MQGRIGTVLEAVPCISVGIQLVVDFITLVSIVINQHDRYNESVG